MSKTVYDHKKIKKQIIAESELHNKFGDGKLISFCMNEIFDHNINDLIEFLTSEDGGYDQIEIKKALNKIRLDKNRYRLKLKSGLRAF